MLHDSISVTANVALLSRGTDMKKFDFANIGGFTVIVDGKPVIFDWESSYGNFERTEEGHSRMEWELVTLDEDFITSSNEDLSEVTWEKIVEGVIDDVNNENGHMVNGLEIHTIMDVEYFHIELHDHTTDKKTKLSFGEDQLKDYNEKVIKEFNGSK